jgi:hypothetical protein
MNKQVLDAPLSPKRKDYRAEFGFLSLSVIFFIASFLWLYLQKDDWDIYADTMQNAMPGMFCLIAHWGGFFILRAFVFRKILKGDDDLHLPAWSEKDSYGAFLGIDSLSYTTIVIARMLFYLMYFPLFLFVTSLVIQVVFLSIFYTMLNDSKISVIAAYVVNSFIWFLILFWKGLKVLEEKES